MGRRDEVVTIEPKPVREVAATWEPIDSIFPWDKNPRKNDGEPVDRVAKSIKRFGFGAPITARAQDNRIIAGHTRWKAAKQLGMTQVPVRFLPLDEAEAAALALADNKLTEITPWDEDVLAEVLRDLEIEQVDLEGLGWASDELEALLSGEAGGSDSSGADKGEAGSDGLSDSYTQKIRGPVYTPKMDKPPAVASLADPSKTAELLAEIDAADLPQDVRDFLRHAAARHTVFHFGRIAEFYCHAPEEVQSLMERSALVIIDFDAAMENGFVKLTDRLTALAVEDGAPDA